MSCCCAAFMNGCMLPVESTAKHRSTLFRGSVTSGAFLNLLKSASAILILYPAVQTLRRLNLVRRPMFVDPGVGAIALRQEAHVHHGFAIPECLFILTCTWNS